MEAFKADWQIIFIDTKDVGVKYEEPFLCICIASECEWNVGEIENFAFDSQEDCWEIIKSSQPEIEQIENINPISCQLQFADVVKLVENCGKGLYIDTIAIITEIDLAMSDNPYKIQKFHKIDQSVVLNKKGVWVNREALKLIERSGITINDIEQVEPENEVKEDEKELELFPRVGQKVWCKFLKKAVTISSEKSNIDDVIMVHCEGFENAIPIKRSDIERLRKKDIPKIDFRIPNRILTDGEFIVKTTGKEGVSFFQALTFGNDWHILNYDKITEALDGSDSCWIDITDMEETREILRLMDKIKKFHRKEIYE